MAQIIVKQWKKPSWIYAFLPLSLMYYFCSFWFIARKSSESNVWVVGNAVVGGAGKTPVVLAIAAWLLEQNKTVVILTRGYGGTNKEPYWVQKGDSAEVVGDEALMLKQALNAPVMVANKRMPAVKIIMQELNPDIIICDDGLQHRNLKYAKAIFLSSDTNNKFVFPVGPMRCSETFLMAKADLVISSNMITKNIANFIDSKGKKHNTLPEKNIVAIAGIANPERFFKLLLDKNYNVKQVAFPDHYQYQAEDFKKYRSNTIVVTAKDAVKIHEDWAKYYIANYQVSLNKEVYEKLSDWLN